jgi:hypothetical protein
MDNHSLISANGRTHAKIALLGVAVSLVFVAVVSASGISRSDSGARAYGPMVKATTTSTVAKGDSLPVR